MGIVVKCSYTYARFDDELCMTLGHQLASYLGLALPGKCS